jgi:hypothetical protein
VAVALRVREPALDGEEAAPNTSSDEDGEYVFVTGIDPQIDLQNLALEGSRAWRTDLQQRGVVLTTALADRLEKQVGDTLYLESPSRTGEFEIVGIIDYPLETAFMDWQQLASFVGNLRDAPTPNAFWESVEVQSDTGGLMDGGTAAWAIGIDERIGKFLYPGFNPDRPGVIISAGLAEADGLERGQEITLHANGDESLLESLTDGNSATYPILEIVEIDPEEMALLMRYAPEELQGEASPKIVALYWPELASLVQLDYSRITPQTFAINLANPQDTQVAFSQPITVFSNEVAFADRIAQTILSLGLMMSFASLLMAVVGSIGLLTITSISVFERQREIGVMRSVGATSRLILRQFLMEGLLIGVIAWIAGLPLSYLLSIILIRSVPFSTVITFSYTPLAAMIGLAGMLLVTAAATFYPSMAAARKTVSEILRYQ